MIFKVAYKLFHFSEIFYLFMIFENCFTKATSLYYYFFTFSRKISYSLNFYENFIFCLRNKKGPVFFIYLFLDESKQKGLNIKML